MFLWLLIGEVRPIVDGPGDAEIQKSMEMLTVTLQMKQKKLQELGEEEVTSSKDQELSRWG